MKLPAFFVLSTLLWGRAHAVSTEGAPSAQRDFPAQTGTSNPPPQPDAAHPPAQTPGESGPRPNGLTFAVGIGYGVGFGTLYSPPTYPSVLPTSNFDPSMRGTVSGQLPISISLGYRPIPRLAFGVALGHAPIFLKDSEFGGSGSDRRLGGELRLHIIPARPFSLWTSAGFGYEWFSYSKNPGVDASMDVSASGYDFDFQVGGDIPMTGPLTIGPYVGLRVGTFRHFRTMCGSRGCAVTDVDIPDANRAAHEWLTFGVRGGFTIVTR